MKHQLFLDNFLRLFNTVTQEKIWLCIWEWGPYHHSYSKMFPKSDWKDIGPYSINGRGRHDFLSCFLGLYILPKRRLGCTHKEKKDKIQLIEMKSDSLPSKSNYPSDSPCFTTHVLIQAYFFGNIMSRDSKPLDSISRFLISFNGVVLGEVKIC